MNNLARTFRDEILRSVFGNGVHKMKPANAARLNQLAENMAASVEAKAILCAKGHGTADQPLASIARNVPAAGFRARPHESDDA